MVTESDKRWPVGLHGTPKRFGKLLDYETFDQAFFSVHGKQAQVRFGLLLHRAVRHLYTSADVARGVLAVPRDGAAGTHPAI